MGAPQPRFVRLAEKDRPAVTITVDGEPVPALAGDTLLVAVLTHFSGPPPALGIRAGGALGLLPDGRLPGLLGLDPRGRPPARL